MNDCFGESENDRGRHWNITDLEENFEELSTFPLSYLNDILLPIRLLGTLLAARSKSQLSMVSFIVSSKTSPQAKTEHSHRGHFPSTRWQGAVTLWLLIDCLLGHRWGKLSPRRWEEPRFGETGFISAREKLCRHLPSTINS